MFPISDVLYFEHNVCVCVCVSNKHLFLFVLTHILLGYQGAKSVICKTECDYDPRIWTDTLCQVQPSHTISVNSHKNQPGEKAIY